MKNIQWLYMSRREAINLSLVSFLLAMSPAGLASADEGKILPAPPPLPALDSEDYLDVGGARIWYGRVGSGPPVVLLHGGLASSGNWGFQVPALLKSGHEVILVDSRGHGRSTMGALPLSYELLADDVSALVLKLGLSMPALVGWSDGAIVALMLARRGQLKLGSVYSYGANMNAAGVKTDAEKAPILPVVIRRLQQDYVAISPTPSDFPKLLQAAQVMQKGQSDYSPDDLSAIKGLNVMIAAGEHDEFITPEHPAYLAKHIPGARLHIFADTGHFTPWDQATSFNENLVEFLKRQSSFPSRTERGA